MTLTRTPPSSPTQQPGLSSSLNNEGRPLVRFDSGEALKNVNGMISSFAAALNAETDTHYSVLSNEYLKPIYDFINSLVTDQDHVLLRDQGIVTSVLTGERNKPPQLVDRIDNDKFRSVLEKIAFKKENGAELSDLETTVSKFYFHQKVMPKIDALRKEMWLQLRSNYNPEKNGEYPIRDVQGRPILIKTIAKADTTNTVLSKLVKSFISSKTTVEERKALYEENLLCREFTERDKILPFESALVGQSMVVAKKEIEKGTCIGVYGGTILDKGDLPGDTDTYMVAAFVEKTGPGSSVLIDGDNILSRINTCFDYKKDGTPYRQSATGYNVEKRAYEVKLENGKSIFLAAFFAAKTIEQGKELRLNYGYDEEAIARKIVGQQ